LQEQVTLLFCDLPRFVCSSRLDAGFVRGFRSTVVVRLVRAHVLCLAACCSDEIEHKNEAALLVLLIGYLQDEQWQNPPSNKILAPPATFNY
jgi:hypothetical protein